jgi:iron-sulfur cluster assembly accessory protein
MSTVTDSPVTLSAGAVTELKRLMSEDRNAEGKFLRIGVKGGGCSGMTYILNFDEKKEGDEFFDIEGIPCVMNPAHEMYLFDMQVDYEGGLNSRGFTFNNPNASKTCGCGTSFAV